MARPRKNHKTMTRVSAFLAAACLSASAAVMLLPATARADYRVIGSLGVEPAPEWGRKAEGMAIAREWWFNPTQMAFVAPGWRYVFDKGRGRILVINTTDGYFIEASVMADTRDLVDREYAESLGRMRANGTIAKTPNRKTVLGRGCSDTAVSEWLLDDNQHVFDRDRNVYATTDVPFDWRMYRDLTTWMVSFFNPEMAYFGGLRSIEGFPLAETDVCVRNGRSTSYGIEIKEIGEATPPKDFYEIPAGLSRKEKLGRRDIQAIRQLLYLAYSF